MPPITLIIPVYNEAESIGRLTGRLRRLMNEQPYIRQTVLVDDGSSDGSGEVMARAIEGEERLRLVRHARNRGYGAALKSGLAAAETEWVAIADADETYPLKALDRLARLIDDGADMAVGARRLAQQPFARRPAKAFLNWLASYLSGTHIPDINSGLRIFRREDALRLARLLPDGFSFTTTITMSLLGEGKQVEYLPIAYRERTGTSKIRPISDLKDFTVLICRMALAFNPLKVFGPIGTLMIAAGCALLAARYMTAERPFGLATTIVFWVGGFQIWAVGFLADLINRRS